MRFLEDLLKNFRQKQRSVIFLLLSLLFHVFLLLCLLRIKLVHKAKTDGLLQVLQDLKKNKPELLASLKPKKSDFGTVVFVEEPSKVIPKKLPMEEKKEKKVEIKNVFDQLNMRQVESLEKKLNEQQQAKTKKKELKLVKEEKKKVELKKVLEQSEVRQVESLKKKLKESSKRKRPKKNIIAMTKGFIENLKNKGEDALEKRGDDSKIPSFEELKYLSYEQRVSWQLQSSWKRNYASKSNVIEGKVGIEFSIDKGGNFLSMKLLQSSGYSDLDSVVMDNIKLAAPFPPLPNHFNVEMYTTRRMIYVSAYRFGF
jgi:TonB family protein